MFSQKNLYKRPEGTCKMAGFREMILRVTALLLIFGTLLPDCLSTMEFTLYPKTRKAKLKYCFIPKSPFRILYEPKSKSTDSTYFSEINQCNSIKSTQFNSRMQSTQSNCGVGSTQCNLNFMGSSQCDSEMLNSWSLQNEMQNCMMYY